MTKKTIHLIAAARPNFMKVAPLYHALKKQDWCQPVLVHTGQHYDANMSDNFLRDLNLPEPDIHLHVGSGTHAEQTAGVMLAYEKVCTENPPDYIGGPSRFLLDCRLAAQVSASADAQPPNRSAGSAAPPSSSGAPVIPEPARVVITLSYMIAGFS